MSTPLMCPFLMSSHLPRVLHNMSSVSRTYSTCGTQPEEHRTQEALEALVVSAQFRSQLDVFGAALQSGQLNLAQFGLQAEVRCLPP